MQTADQQVKDLIANNKVMCFSKSYCPFAAQTKQSLKAAGCGEKVIELDVVAGGDGLHQALKQICGRGTVPQTYVNGKHVGGNDDLQAAIKNGKFKQMLNDAGVSHSL